MWSKSPSSSRVGARARRRSRVPLSAHVLTPSFLALGAADLVASVQVVITHATSAADSAHLVLLSDKLLGIDARGPS